jgi:isocitrate lyase
MGPTIVAVRTDADAANLLTSDIDQEMHSSQRKKQEKDFST